MRLAEEGWYGAGNLTSVSQSLASGCSLKGPELDLLAWGLLSGAWGAAVFTGSTGHPQLCFGELEPDTWCGCKLAVAKGGSTAGVFSGTVNCGEVLYKVTVVAFCLDINAKSYFFDQGTCNLSHLSSQMLLHGSFLAVVLAGLHFHGCSQATPCLSVSSPAHLL